MKHPINIRQATVEDLEMLVRIARKSFYDTFAPYPENAPEDLQKYMDEHYTVEAFAAELADPLVTYFVAEIAGAPAGYAKLKRQSREAEIAGAHPIELCRLYNLHEFIGKGVGKALMLRCLEFAERHGHDTIWLGVWGNNTRAVDFYRRFGFEKCGEHVFRLGGDAQTDWLMQRSVGRPEHKGAAGSLL